MMLIKLKGKYLMIAQVYVDDIVFYSTAESLKNEFVKFMEAEFEMSMIGQLNYFLGLHVKQLANGVFLSQKKYAQNMVEKFGLRDSKRVRTPLGQQDKLSKMMMERHVGVCARFQSTPKESHLKAAKRILRYVKGTAELGLWYLNRSGLDLIGFTYSDWADCCDDRKSTTSGCFYIGDNIVNWCSKKQNSISLSTAEAEYIAAGSCCAQLLWIRQMLHDYGIGQDSLTLFCDNTSAINISKNPFNMEEQSTSTYDTILFETWWKIECVI
ncbi:uncharacterized mitochondrial protein AtMg00810-like [Andrographis paniculata]|uniref:uncharacterized mitochondrial protein AtMg00810-like n=1 Tax=Andrographis paniculata TaxID=175694 RepID=UPI0021E7C14C|nr:uncharacterized mitochondrial protein AtMg00810-like [Andrographis paniculata]